MENDAKNDSTSRENSPLKYAAGGIITPDITIFESKYQEYAIRNPNMAIIAN
jgi:hypothetical protein